ncbi:hypothetical protein CF8_0009 [Aeromonas phage CF8]|nr:hypothetical protein CF8_0009 [Aeromonas phage CF8]
MSSNNPVGSTAMVDLFYNAGNLDKALNSDQDHWRDRFGKERITYAYMEKLANTQALVNQSRESLRRSYAEVGLNLVSGSFEQGGTLESETDVLLEEKSGKVYGWEGDFPKVVPSKSLPTANGFVLRIHTSLREQLGIFPEGGIRILSSDNDINSVISSLPDSGGIVLCPPGDYTITDVELRDNITIAGFGNSTVFHVPENRQGFQAISNDPDPSSNIKGIILRDFKIKGSGTFNEHKHLIDLNGVSDYIIEGIFAENPQGDHIYLGSGRTPGMERHNVNGLILNNKFISNGVGNRNAISIIDADGLSVYNNDFDGCSRPSMPGDIDLEPNNSFSVLKNINIYKNRSKNCRGSTAIVGLFVNISTGFNQGNYENINIVNNKFETPINSSCADFFVDFSQNTWVDDKTLPIITFVNNKSVGTKIPFIIRSAPHVRFERNMYRDFYQSALVGLSREKDAVHLIEIIGDDFDDFLNGVYAVRFMNFKTLRIKYSSFGELGNGSSNAAPLGFVNGRSDTIEISGNTFNGNNGAQKWIYSSGHVFSPINNICRDNIFNSHKPIMFPAYNNNGPQEFNNGYSANTPPSLLPLGKTISCINSPDSGLPPGYTQGILATSKINATNGFCCQQFFPRDDGGINKKSEQIYRTSNSSGDTWHGWYKLTGIGV